MKDDLIELLRVCEAILEKYSPDRERLLNLKQVLDRTGLCRTAVFDYRKNGKFPEPVVVGKGSRRKRWPESAIDEWIRAQVPPDPDSKK